LRFVVTYKYKNQLVARIRDTGGTAVFPLQAAWLYYLENPALVLNALALFFAVNGSWLWIATQLRSSLGRQRLATLPPSESDLGQHRDQRINRLFYSVGGLCLGLATVLTLTSTQF
tara:strand:+ start:582 stop:929 length:348 start_codon:yes stop_codon:yes gene_type:complete